MVESDLTLKVMKSRAQRRESLAWRRRENWLETPVSWPPTFAERFLNYAPGCDRSSSARLTSINRRTCTLRPSFYVAGNVSTSASITFPGRRCILNHSVFWLRNNRRMAFESWNEIVWDDKAVQPSHQPENISIRVVCFFFFFVRLLALSAPNDTTRCHIGLTVCRFVSCREIKQNFRLFQFSPRVILSNDEGLLSRTRKPIIHRLCVHEGCGHHQNVSLEKCDVINRQHTWHVSLRGRACCSTGKIPN